MFKKVKFHGLNYRDLDQLDAHDLKSDQIKSFYQTFDFLDLVKRWPEIIGSKLATVTSPLKIQGDSLVIMAKHSSYSQNISFLSEEIKEKIFKIFPKLKPVIKKIVFLTKENFFNNQESIIENKKHILSMHPQDPRFKILKIEAEKLFEDVEDPELKKVLISLFMQSR